MAIPQGRTVYVAIGDFPDSIRESVRDQLRLFDESLKAGSDSESASSVFPPDAQPVAIEAANLIREFERRVGEECGAQVGNDSSPLAEIPPERSISVENRGARLFGAEVAELASQVAGALERLLVAIGATKTISGWFD